MMTETERRILREAVETTRYMNSQLWERVEKKRGRSVKVDYICPPVPSNPSLSWDNALLRLVKFAENALQDNSPMRLHESSLMLQTARKVLMNLHETGMLLLDGGIKGEPRNDKNVYTNAIYELLLHDDIAMLEWLAGTAIMFVYYDHKRDEKGRLTECKAKRKTLI